MKRSLSVAPRGLTLIELVVVMAILATLAAIIVPRLDFLRNQAEHATAASNISDMMTLLQTQKTSSGAYPNLDLLVDETGTAYSKVWNTGTSPFTVAAISGPASGSWYRSFLEGGLVAAYANSSTATNASSSSAATPTVLQTAFNSGSVNVAELNYSASPQSGGHPYVGAIDDALFPTGLDSTGAALGTNVKLIAMGIGPLSGMAGSVTASTPLDTQGDIAADVYCRYIAIFAVYKSGKPAELKMVVDHRMKMLDKRIDQYNKSGSTGI